MRKGSNEKEKRGLKALLVLRGDSVEDYAKVIGLSTNRTYSRLAGTSEFTHTEIVATKERYGLTGEEIDELFFS